MFWGLFAEAANAKMIMRADLDNTQIWSTFKVVLSDCRKEEEEMTIAYQRGVAKEGLAELKGVLHRIDEDKYSFN